MKSNTLKFRSERGAGRVKNRLRAWELAMLALTAALILALLLYPAPEPGVYAESGSAVVGLEAAAADGRLNVNTATAAELELLPGIGPVKAQAIVDYRAEHGAFDSAQELLNVSGIGEATLAGLIDYITVEDGA